MKILGFICFDLTLDSHTRRIHCLATPCLGTNTALSSNNILARFNAILNCSTQILSFRNSAETILAIHRHEMSSLWTFSQVALVDDATPVKVHTHYCVSACPFRNDTEVQTPEPSHRSTVIFVEPRIVHNMGSSVSPSRMHLFGNPL